MTGILIDYLIVVTMKREKQDRVAAWLWIGVSVLIALLLVWLTIFEYWSA